MPDLFPILALGFLLGMRHATDPDHVVAVTTIVSRQRNLGSAAVVGAIWGVGHTLTILAVGSGIILFDWVIPGRLGLAMEFAVALMLIILGVANLRSFRSLSLDTERLHSHPHSHGDFVHTHPHHHAPEAHGHDPSHTPLTWLDRHAAGLPLYRMVRPLLVGIVHGLAGSAAVALAVLTTISNPRWAVFYLFLFGLGTIAGMMLITTAIASPILVRGAPSPVWAGRIRVATGLVSVVFGGWLAWQTGIVDGLFGATPHWTPH